MGGYSPIEINKSEFIDLISGFVRIFNVALLNNFI